MSKRQEWARCADGTRISFQLLESAGAGNARIALVHSLAMDHTFWLPVVERLEASASVLMYDCRGHGASDKPTGPYTTELFGRDLADLLDHVGWPSAAVAGASMGGCISMAFAVASPQRIKALGLIDSTAWYGSEAPAQWQQRAHRAQTEGLKGLIDFQVTRWFGDAFRAKHPEIIQHCADVFLANDLPAYGETCRMLGAYDMRAALPSISCPTTVIVGEEDYATPIAMAESLHSAIANSRMVVIKKARHLTPLEVPDRIVDELNRLLQSIAS